MDNTEDGDRTQYWTDHSSNRFDASQPKSGQRPIYDLTNAINLNPIITFDGTNDDLPITGLNY